MLVGVVSIEVADILFHFLGSDLAVMARKDEDLMAAVLDGSTFVHVDVCRLGSHHSLMTSQEGIDDRCIGLRPAYKKLHQGIWCLARLTYEFLSLGTIVVSTIAHGVFKIGLDKALHHFGMCTCSIVGSEIQHGIKYKGSA